MTISITNMVSNFVSVITTDYGLDNIPYTVSQTGQSTALLAFVSWSVAQHAWEAPTASSPAVNVTDSAGNLWRQIAISTVGTINRSAVWIADNPRQTSWVSVALTGWAASTNYMICEMDSVPTSMQGVSVDFVQTVNSTVPATTFTLSATPTTSDVVLGAASTTGLPGALGTPPAGFTFIGLAAPFRSADAGISGYYIPSTSSPVTFSPTWTDSEPYSGLLLGLKLTSAAPAQPNPNMPAVVVEAAFGAAPGDTTESVDYTWDITGLTWTDISARCVGKEGDTVVRVQRGRQYELSQEETGEIEIMVDNHDGAFTSGNTASPYYPFVVPGVPIRVTAWFDGVQYPVAFGYVERWPQEWPDMPQYGFSTLTAVDAFGPMSANTMVSAVKGEIEKDSPYAYFPTEEQYETTSQSLDPVASPIDANGLLSVNISRINSRFGAYRDGTRQPVTTGQALNLLGDSGSVLGASTYIAQENDSNGPGMFYFDPNIPTNANGASFSIEFWFVWGNGTTFDATLLSAFGKPSSFYANRNSQPFSTPTNGGVITVGVQTGSKGGNLPPQPSAFLVNGLDITNGTFNATTSAPQHFVLTTSPSSTACYLNGALAATSPTLVTIPQIRAVVLGPARFSYDVSDMVVYNGYNFTAGHLALYSHQLSAATVKDHYSSGVNGYAGVTAARRYAQILTWAELGLKRGGTAWYAFSDGANSGIPEGTYISEAYQYDGTSASDGVSQLTQTANGRCYSQANGSIIWVNRWNRYNLPVVATFGDNGTTEFPFEQETSFSLDNQFIYNFVYATQSRGPNQDVFYTQHDEQSHANYFHRSGLQIQSFAYTPFDVSDAVNWSLQKYKQPSQRCLQLVVDVAKSQGKNPGLFPAVLSTELDQVVTVNRRPVGGAVISITGPIQEIRHEIGAAAWRTTYQIAPAVPEQNALIADVTGQNSPATQYLAW